MLIRIMCRRIIATAFVVHLRRRQLRLISLFYNSFFGSIIPLIYFFIQHKVHSIPGGACFRIYALDSANKDLAYTRYSFFEWALIVFDILYDSVAELDFKEANIQVCWKFKLSIITFPPRRVAFIRRLA
jgi:hypothetical protein